MNENIDPAGDNRPTVLLLEEDDDVQRSLKGNLRLRGFLVLVAVSMEDALEWVTNSRTSADLLLVDLVGTSTEEALDVGRRLRSSAKYDGPTPLIVMADKYGKDVEGTEVNVQDNDWIFYLGEESGQLHHLIESLLKKTA